MLEGITISNGLGWSPDDRSFYYVDSLTYAVLVFDYDAELGTLANSREFVTFDPVSGVPDGLSVDEHGGVWVAHFGTGTISHHEPSGRVIAEHHFPAPNVTSLAFGGIDGTDVLVTTATYTMSEVELAQCPTAGDIFGGSFGLRGAPTNLFVVS
jgi:hypothetical protein